MRRAMRAACNAGDSEDSDRVLDAAQGLRNHRPLGWRSARAGSPADDHAQNEENAKMDGRSALPSMAA